MGSLLGFGGRGTPRASGGAVALAVHEHVVRRVDDSVQYPLGHHWVWEQAVPVGRRSVRREHQGAPPSLTDQVVEIVRLRGRERAEGEIIEDEQPGPRPAP